MKETTKQAGMSSGMTGAVLTLVAFLAQVFFPHVTIPGEVIAAAGALLVPIIHSALGANSGSATSNPNANNSGA